MIEHLINDSVTLYNIEEITNINNITNIEHIKKMIEHLISQKGEAKAETKEELTQCSFITDEEAKAECEKSMSEYEDGSSGKEKETPVSKGEATDEEPGQCFYIDDPAAKADCENAL